MTASHSSSTRLLPSVIYLILLLLLAFDPHQAANAFVQTATIPTVGQRSSSRSSWSTISAATGNDRQSQSQSHSAPVSTPQQQPRRQVLLDGMTKLLMGTVAVLTMPKIDLADAATGSETKALGEEYRQGTAALADMDEAAPVPREAYRKLSSGVILADLRPGVTNQGIVNEGSRVNLQWVLRKSNGYFVDSSATNDSVPFIFTVGDGTAIAGVDEGVRGMAVGGVRRLLIPPSLAYVQGLEDGKPGPLPVGFGPRQQMRRVQNIRKDVPGEYVFLEVQVTKIR